MGKALVIKNANFYANRLAHISFNDKPCTGISLDCAEATVEEPLTLVATTTPADTTDVIIWSSSNEDVATVDNGTVYAVANGTATITATCGNYSASCVVTATIPAKIAKGNTIQVGTLSSSVLRHNALCSPVSNQIGYGSSSGTYVVCSHIESGDITEVYPIPIPSGATSIQLSIPSDYAAWIVYYDKNTPYHKSGDYRDVAYVLDGQTPAGGTNWSIPTFVYGNQTFQIPDTEGINSFTLAFKCKDSTAYNNFTSDMVNITYGYN